MTPVADPSAILLRDFRSEDADAVARLWMESWASTGLGRPGDPQVEDYRERLLKESASCWRIRLACRRETIAGFLAWEPERAWLRQLFVAPEHQGQGIGTLLLDQAKRDLAGGFWLRTDVGNLGARRFYERRGLHLQGEAPHPEHGRMIAVYGWPDADAGLR